MSGNEVNRHIGRDIRFGQRAIARRARQRRRKRAIVAVWIVSMLAGIPAAWGNFSPLGRLGGGEEGLAAGDIAAVNTSKNIASATRFRRQSFVTRPRREKRQAKPVQTPAAEPVAPAPAGSVGEIIYAAAAEFGLDGGYLLSVASCESNLDPGAVNASGYHGLFQFDQQTWSAYGYGSIYDPVAQARTAARLLAAGQSSRWPNCA